MSRKTLIASAALAGFCLLAAGGAAFAQGGAQGGGRGGPLGMLGRYDADGDGKISLSEYETGRQAAFNRMDTDGNGALSFAEIDAATAAAAQRGGNMAQMMQARMAALKAADTNGDQSISADEYKAYADAEFKKLDTNGDGFISADEAQAGMGGH